MKRSFSPLILALLLYSPAVLADGVPVSATVRVSLQADGDLAAVRPVVERRLRALADLGAAPVTGTSWKTEGKQATLTVELLQNPCKGRVFQCVLDAATGAGKPACDAESLANWKHAIEKAASTPGVMAFSSVIEGEQAALLEALRGRPELASARVARVERGGVEIEADERAIRMAIASVKPSKGRVAASMDSSPEPGASSRALVYVVPEKPDLVIRQVESATIVEDPEWAPQVTMAFSEGDGAAFGELTERLVQRILIVELDGRVESAPVVMEPILGGRASVVTCSPSAGPECTREGAILAATLGGGALPVPVTVTRVEGSCAR